MRVYDVADERDPVLVADPGIIWDHEGDRGHIDLRRHIESDVHGSPADVDRKFFNLAGLPGCHVHVAVLFREDPDVSDLRQPCCHLLRDILRDLVVREDLLPAFRIRHPDRVGLVHRFDADIRRVCVIRRIKLADVDQVFVILDVYGRVQDCRTVGIFLHITGICEIPACGRDDIEERLPCLGTEREVVEFRRRVLMVLIQRQDGRVRAVSVLSVVLRERTHKGA